MAERKATGLRRPVPRRTGIGIGDEFIEALKTLHKLGLDATDPVEVRGSPREEPTRGPKGKRRG
jgi:saccharopine dehydrogenase-like NADP-dependent oxidoreductase